MTDHSPNEMTYEELCARIAELTQLNVELRQTNSALRLDLKEEREERKSHEEAAKELQERIDQLEDDLEDASRLVSDPDALCEYVHDFLLAAGALPEPLSVPFALAPNDYRFGLRDAVNRVCDP